MSTRRKLVVAAFALLAAIVSPAQAPAMTLSHAIEAGAERGPAVIAGAKTRDAAADFASDPGSALPMPPTIYVMAGVRKPINLPLGPEVQVTVSQELSARGLGTARRRAAEWASRAASSDLERARLEGALTAALAWVDLLEAQQLRSARHLAVADAEKVARLAEARVTSGIASSTERSLASAEVGAAKVALLDAEGRATEARFALALAVGDPLDSAIVAEGSIEPAPDPALDGRRVIEEVHRHPALLAAEARASQAAAEIDVASATNGPLYSIGATAWREGSGDKAAAAIVTLPLPFFDGARYQSAHQATIAAAVSGHASMLRGELEREVRVALHERDHTREVRSAVLDQVVTPLRAALATAILAYGAGNADLGVVLLARRSALGAEERLVSASADVQRADLRVAAVAGVLVARRAR